MFKDFRERIAAFANFLIQVQKFLEVVQSTLNGFIHFLQGMSD